MRILAPLALLLASLALGASATAHAPGSDGGPAKRDCGVIRGVSEFGPVGVGATKVRCRKARRIARGSVTENRTFPRWRCSGRGTRFGHCHRRGARSRIVHWYAAEGNPGGVP